jgi:hypothetical protein
LVPIPSITFDYVHRLAVTANATRSDSLELHLRATALDIATAEIMDVSFIQMKRDVSADLSQLDQVSLPWHLARIITDAPHYSERTARIRGA